MTQPKPTVRVAILTSSRPDQSTEEAPTYRGASVALDQLAADPSQPYQISASIHDDRDDRARTVELAQVIAADPEVVAVIGPGGSSSAMLCAPIFDAAGVVEVSPCASHPLLTRSGYRTFFRLVADDDRQGRALAELGRVFLGGRTAAMLHDTDAFGSGLRDVVVPEFERLGGQVVAIGAVERWSTDFGQQIASVVEAKPEVVFFAVHEPEGKALATGLRQVGAHARFVGTDAMKPSLFLWTGQGEGPYHTFAGADIRRLASAAAFRQAYVARFLENSVYSAEGYDAVMLIADALKRAATRDRAGVLAAVRQSSGLAGASGPIRFDERGDRVDAPIGFYQVRDGSMTYLGMTSELSNKTAPAMSAQRS